MIRLAPISEENIRDFAGTSYQSMSTDEKLHMIRESMRREHEGAYFELLAVWDDDQIVGFMSLYAHSAHIISISPEIKENRRMKGYAYLGEIQALQYAKDAGYTIAVAGVRKENPASIALHRKLGFEEGAQCLSKKGNEIRIFIKAL